MLYAQLTFLFIESEENYYEKENFICVTCINSYFFLSVPVAAKEIQTAAHQMTVLKSLLASMTGRAATGGLQLMN